MNPNASSFIPRASAPSFVPGQSFRPPPPPVAAPEPAPSTPTSSTPAPPISKPVKEKEEVDDWEKEADRDSTPLTSTPTAPSPAPPASVPAPSPTPVVCKTETSAPAPSKKEKVKSTPTATTTSDHILAEASSTLSSQEYSELFTSKDAVPTKSHLNIVFIGHVDAGKSTMGGNLLYLTGMVDKRTLEKFEKEAKEKGRESWYLSWALDSTTQERVKGITVEVGRAYFETSARRYTILDAPGHKNYVPSMISGAAQADVGILVISARKGEFETGFEKGGQTREHAMLVKTAGVGKLVVVVNKMDESTVGWDKTRYDEIVNKLTPFLKQTGFNPKTDVFFIPVSGFTGANLKDRLAKGVCPWYSGPSLLEYLDTMPISDRKLNAPLMLPISEKYKDMGMIVVGKVESGKVRKGEPLLLMPNKTPVEVQAIYNEMEEEIPLAISGDNVRIRLKGVDDDDMVSVGFVLTDPNHPVKVARAFEAQVVILEHKNIITAGYGAVMHVHTLAEEVSLSALLRIYDRKVGKWKKTPPQFAKTGQRVWVLIETTAPVCIEPFKEHPQLGRLTLRDEGKTIAIGKVTKILESVDDADLSKLSLNEKNVGGVNTGA